MAAILIGAPDADGARWFAGVAAVTLLPATDREGGAHLLLIGAGLTPPGAPEGSYTMHRGAQENPAPTDGMRMVLIGMEGGKPVGGAIDAPPERFYKGDGSPLVASGAPPGSSAFALDVGEEPEIAGIYPDDAPVRLGFALANEFSDHGKYWWLAHAKPRHAALGPEMPVGDLPQEVRGSSRIRSDSDTFWKRPFVSGEATKSHGIANLERHHLKYGLFRRSGDVHPHLSGTATLSSGDGVRTRRGDMFEIEVEPFTLPARDPIAAEDAVSVAMRTL